MNYTQEKREKMRVIGVPIRTSNANFQKEVPPLWEKFFREQLASKIPHRTSQNLLSVYTDYAGDYTQPFTYLIGCEVSSLDEVPAGMRGIEIPAASYAVFTAKGDFPQSMGEVWQTIWNSDALRSYTIDFEIYGADFNPQNNPEVNIYIATKAQ